MTATISPNSIIAIIKDQVYNANSSHPFFKQLLEAVKERDEDKFLEYFNKDIKEELVKTGKIHIEGDTLYFNGIELHNSLTTRIIEMFKGGFPIDHMMTFLENLMKNPSSSSVNELYTFLEHKNLPITDDGCFLAYKAVLTYNGEPFVDTNGRDVVNGCFVDKYSGQIRNNIGDVLEMPRNQVDDNRNVGCSKGYHVGALEYSGPNGWYSDNRTTTLIVKVNPADVVSVPVEINCTKLRACKYEVVGVYKAPLNKPIYEEEDELDWDDDFDTDIGYFKIEVDEIVIGDLIRFDYQKDGEVKERSVIVEEIYDETIYGYLDHNDPSYDYEAASYRCFKKSKMSNVRLIED